MALSSMPALTAIKRRVTLLLTGMEPVYRVQVLGSNSPLPVVYQISAPSVPQLRVTCWGP